LADYHSIIAAILGVGRLWHLFGYLSRQTTPAKMKSSGVSAGRLTLIQIDANDSGNS
jgi:hypothetical protein